MFYYIKLNVLHTSVSVHSTEKSDDFLSLQKNIFFSNIC